MITQVLFDRGDARRVHRGKLRLDALLYRGHFGVRLRQLACPSFCVPRSESGRVTHAFHPITGGTH